MFPQADPVAVLVRYHTPNFYTAVVAWYYVAPGVAVYLIGQFLISTSRIWFARMGVSLGLRSRLPAWPLSPTADGPAIVVGEVHHPVKPIESPNPEWLTIPERGLYTGVAIFGAVGSGKTSACMHPFARQLLSWQAHDPDRRPAALILEVKGDFCHDIRAILKDAKREADYIELSLDGQITWNPLSATWLDSYSLAYTVASLLNQLFGKGKEPFWQQAYTNLVRWIIELYRVLPHPRDGSDDARMGDASRRVPLCDRQGTFRQENQRGAGVRPRQVRRMDHHRPGDDARRDKHFRAWRHRVSTAPGTARPTPGAVQSRPE